MMFKAVTTGWSVFPLVFDNHDDAVSVRKGDV